MVVQHDSAGRKFVRSDKNLFLVTLVTKDMDEVNTHCENHSDRGMIATDDQGFHYVALNKAEMT